MDKQYDIIALGECLVDFVCTEEKGMLRLEGNPGGAPANVLAMAAKLGRTTALVSKVGRDHFGDFLIGHIRDAGVETGYLLSDGAHPTTLAIVKLDESGNRSFSFYRDRTADVMLRQEELPMDGLRSARVMHFGSLSLVVEPSREATFTAVRAAKEAGAAISYDPNWRAALWSDHKLGLEMMHSGMALADYAKVSDEELGLLTGEKDLEAGAEALLRRYPLRLLAVTLGPGGCILYTPKGRFSAPAFAVDCVDTTGAGDAFWGAALSWLLERKRRPEDLSGGELGELMDFAAAAGSLATTKLGAISAMPTREEIGRCIAVTPRI